MTKTCAKCGQTKVVDCFNRDRSTKDGFQTQCRACWKVIYAAQRKAGQRP